MTAIAGIQTALASLQAHMENLDRTASRIASTEPGPDIARDMVGLMQIEHGVKANVAVIRTADEVVGTVLDLLV